jgi:adenine/guanine phosphoribosyltransferase-like PRPP-binding protein
MKDDFLAYDWASAVAGSWFPTPVTDAPPAALAPYAGTPKPRTPRSPAPSYTRPVFDMAKMPRIAHWAAGLVKSLDAEAVVASGHSGLVLAGAVSLLTGVPTFAVRKPGEERLSHGMNRVSAHSPTVARWVFLDDFIDSGSTLRNAAKLLHDEGLISTIWPTALLLYGGRTGHMDVNRDRWIVDFPEGFNFHWGSAPARIPAYGWERD